MYTRCTVLTSQVGCILIISAAGDSIELSLKTNAPLNTNFNGEIVNIGYDWMKWQGSFVFILATHELLLNNQLLCALALQLYVVVICLFPPIWWLRVTVIKALRYSLLITSDPKFKLFLFYTEWVQASEYNSAYLCNHLPILIWLFILEVHRYNLFTSVTE